VCETIFDTTDIEQGQTGHSIPDTFQHEHRSRSQETTLCTSGIGKATREPSSPEHDPAAHHRSFWNVPESQQPVASLRNVGTALRLPSQLPTDSIKRQFKKKKKNSSSPKKNEIKKKRKKKKKQSKVVLFFPKFLFQASISNLFKRCI